MPENEFEPNLVETAFDKLINATTLEEMKLIFEQERSLFLSETMELLRQHLLACALQSETEEQSDALHLLHSLKTFFDLQRLGKDEEAWKFVEEEQKRFEEKEQQHTEKVFDAFHAIEKSESLEDLHAILVDRQAYLLTEKADDVLDFLIQEIEEGSGDPHLHFLLQTRYLLHYARIIGMQDAIEESGMQVYQAMLAEKRFPRLLDNWLQINPARDQRRFLEEHLEIIQPYGARLLQNFIEENADDPELVSFLNDHLKLLREIIQRGGTIQDIRETYINVAGGFALDIPSWLEEIESQYETLAEQSSNSTLQIQLLREAITRAQSDADVAPETIATLQYSLGTDLSGTPQSDPLYADYLEEALAAQTAALQIFTLAQYPRQHAGIQGSVASLYTKRVKGSRHENLELALRCYEVALQVQNRTDFPLAWAEIQSHLGEVYRQRTAGDKSGNLEYALACQETAQEVFQQSTFPFEWAKIQVNLGVIFSQRVAGERRENLRHAIKHHHQAWQVYTRETFPLEWAKVHLLLGSIYTDFGLIIDPGTNTFEQALEHYKQAEEVLTREKFPDGWTLIQQGLVLAYIKKEDEHREYNLCQAISHGEAVLHVLTFVAQPLEWASIHVRLGEAYSQATAYANSDAFSSNRSEIEELALKHIEMALQVYTQEGHPQDWAEARLIRGEIYLQRIRGQRDENLAQARRCGESALQVFSREFSSLEWARTQTLLGSVFLSSQEKGKETIEQAIEYFRAALEICQPTTFLIPWARNRINLCHAYIERVEGDPQQNLETAIQHGEAVCQVLTKQNAPIPWAEAQFYLGAAYFRRTSSERRVNIEQSIACSEKSLLVFTRENAPLLWAAIQVGLSAAYDQRVEGKPDRNAALSLQYAQNALEIYTEENVPQEWANLQLHLGRGYLNLFIKGSIDDHAQEAEKHLEMAWRAYKNNGDHLNAAFAQLLLGGYYQTLALSRNPIEHKQQALSYYHASLQTFTRETTPLPWARTQLALGMAYGLPPDQKSATSEREQAMRFLQQALSIFTSESFPHEYRRILNISQFIAWQQGNWRKVAELSQRIHQVEEDLLRTSTGTSGFDKILAERPKPSPAALGAFAWLLQRRLELGTMTLERGWLQDRARSMALQMAPPEDIEQAVITLEHGRAQELARLTVMHLTAPERIQNLERRRRYTNAREELQRTRAALAKMASLNEVESVSLDDRQTFLDIASASEVAQQVFDETLAEIRLAQDPADFLQETVDIDTLRQAVTQVGPGHTLIYLVALEEVGGFALAVQATSKLGNAPLLLESCMLPGLTSDLVHSLVKNGTDLDLLSCQEKLEPILLRPLLRWLRKKINPSSLTLISCGYLAGLPLTALFVDETETLGDKWPISVAPSARSLLYRQTTDKRRSGVYAFGNPEVNLPWGEAEAYTLKNIAHQLQIENHLRVQWTVTSQTLFQSLEHALVIDLACHGKVKPDDYLRSHLRLANKEWLTLGTILNWKREMQGLRLLILSACQSAVPDIQGAIDEVRSLSSAMLQAGACAVLAPLWAVDDRATYLLMTRFAQEWFPRMQTELPAAALARAQRWLRNVTNRELRHWEATLPKSNEEQQESILASRNGESELSRTRYDMGEAQKKIRRYSTTGNPGAHPYADPIHWAGFQIVGW